MIRIEVGGGGNSARHLQVDVEHGGHRLDLLARHLAHPQRLLHLFVHHQHSLQPPQNVPAPRPRVLLQRMRGLLEVGGAEGGGAGGGGGRDGRRGTGSGGVQAKVHLGRKGGKGPE